MSTNISRRKVVAGAAWAAPVVAASAAVPAFASSTQCEPEGSAAYTISGTAAGAKTVKTFKVPAKVDKISFTIIGGAGGTVLSDAAQGGSGAKLTGTIEVKEGQVVEIVAAAGGIGKLVNGRPSEPVTGGEGYGNGGSPPAFTIPSDVIAEVNSRWSKDSMIKRPAMYGSSGGGSSALVVDGTVVAVAGGGGGAGITVAGGSNNVAQNDPKDGAYYNPKAIDAGWRPRNIPISARVVGGGGSATAAAGSDGIEGIDYYTEPKDPTTGASRISIGSAAGKGGANGTGGAGAAKPGLPSGNRFDTIGFSSQNNQVLFSSSAAGNQGGSGFNGNGADGTSAYSYQLDNNDKNTPEIVYPGGGTTGTARYMTYPDVGFNFNGHQAIVSSGGGAGYGGGGSGAARALSAILVNQKWNGNTAPNGLRQNISYGIQAGAGGAGGSYLASNVINGAIESSGNGATGPGVRNPGSVEITFCKRS